MLSYNALLLYVQKAGGWRSASVLLRVYASVGAGMDRDGGRSATGRNPGATGGHGEGLAVSASYRRIQNPWASMPSAVLNLLRKFSSATAAVSSTICASLR